MSDEEDVVQVPVAPVDLLEKAGEALLEGVEEAPEAQEEATATEETPSEQPAKVVDEYAQKRAELDSGFAVLRRRDQAMRAQEAELKRRMVELDARSKEPGPDHYARMMRENPLTFSEQVAKAAGMQPSEYLEKLQRRYLNQGAPGPDEIRDEVKAGFTDLKAEFAEVRREREALAQEREAQRVEAKKVADAELLVSSHEKGADRWRYLTALKKVDEGIYQDVMRDAIELAHQSKGEYTAGEILNFLDDRERKEYEKRAPFGEHLGPATPGDEQKAESVSGSPPKPAAKRTVTNKDAASNGGGRRELTEEERILEADRVLNPR